jgi:hypothetical protein
MTPEEEAALEDRIGKLERDFQILQKHYWEDSTIKIRRLETNTNTPHELEPLHPHRDPHWSYHPQPIIGDPDPTPGIHHAGHDPSPGIQT